MLVALSPCDSLHPKHKFQHLLYLGSCFPFVTGILATAAAPEDARCHRACHQGSFLL